MKNFNMKDIEHLTNRLKIILDLVNAGENNMAAAKLLADIFALQQIKDKEKSHDTN